VAEIRFRFDEVNMWLVTPAKGRPVREHERWWVHYCRLKRDLIIDKTGTPSPCECGVQPPPLTTAVPTNRST
jgi:hypothetical protein